MTEDKDPSQKEGAEGTGRAVLAELPLLAAWEACSRVRLTRASKASAFLSPQG